MVESRALEPLKSRMLLPSDARPVRFCVRSPPSRWSKGVTRSARAGRASLRAPASPSNAELTWLKEAVKMQLVAFVFGRLRSREYASSRLHGFAGHEPGAHLRRPKRGGHRAHFRPRTPPPLRNATNAAAPWRCRVPFAGQSASWEKSLPIQAGGPDRHCLRTLLRRRRPRYLAARQSAGKGLVAPRCEAADRRQPRSARTSSTCRRAGRH